MTTPDNLPSPDLTPPNVGPTAESPAAQEQTTVTKVWITDASAITGSSASTTVVFDATPGRYGPFVTQPTPAEADPEPDPPAEG